jgi:hypothetical protein
MAWEYGIFLLHFYFIHYLFYNLFYNILNLFTVLFLYSENFYFTVYT